MVMVEFIVFWLNEILRRDGVVPEPLILPISTVLVEDLVERMNVFLMWFHHPLRVM